ncbi:MAG: hypothetical protein KatS3mg111_3741 [Pirellulaceae bacterium]|nr:MAG: hypothetical protein KatS3mg111_3741 [Pirellulaceae bacterium]
MRFYPAPASVGNTRVGRQSGEVDRIGVRSTIARHDRLLSGPLPFGLLQRVFMVTIHHLVPGAIGGRVVPRLDLSTPESERFFDRTN